MNQSELIAKVADAADLDKSQAQSAVEAALDAVADALKNGDKVSLSSLGVFDVQDRKARQGRNPATGEAIQIAASKSIKFRPSKSLKDAVSPPVKSKAVSKKASAAKKSGGKA